MGVVLIVACVLNISDVSVELNEVIIRCRFFHVLVSLFQ